MRRGQRTAAALSAAEEETFKISNIHIKLSSSLKEDLRDVSSLPVTDRFRWSFNW